MIRPHLGCFVLVLAVSLGCPARGRAGDNAEWDDLKRRVIEARKKLRSQQAKQAALRFELKHLVAARLERVEMPQGTALGVPETVTKILEHLYNEDKNNDLSTSRLEREKALALLRNWPTDSQAVTDCWEKTTRKSFQLLDELAAEETRLHLRVAPLGPGLRPEWNARRSWLEWDGPTARTVFWMWLIVTASLWLSGQLGRRERRSWWRGRGGLSQLAVGAILSVAAVTWVAVLGLAVAKLIEVRLLPVGAAPDAGPREALREALRAEAEQVGAQADAIERDNSKDRQRVETRRSEAFDKWTQTLGVAAKSGLEKTEREAADRVQEALARVYERKLLAEDAKAASDRLEKDRGELASAVSIGQAQAVTRAWARLIAIGVLILLPFIPPLLLVRRQLRRRRRAARECPRCAAREKLETVPAPVRDERYPEPKFVHCKVCEYQFRDSHSLLARLCFPTVGLVHSGKTHWLLETYAQIDEGRLPTPVQMTKAPSLGDQTLDDMVRRLRANYQRPRATVETEGKFPYPITLHLQDLDSTPSRVLINLFDFGGAMTTRSIDISVLRRRALMMDGFVFFLDPTRPTEEHSLQQAALKSFAQDIREMRGLPPEARLDVPVAVCLSKLDLLPTRTEFSGRAKSWLRKLRQTQGRPGTLAVLRQRSRLVRESLLPLFPGWPVEDDLRTNFGHNFLYFPLTPVGLEERELAAADSTDLRDRTLAPFGVTEPVLWLLHMHGYRVLG